MPKTKTTPVKPGRKCPMCPVRSYSDKDFQEHVFHCALESYKCDQCDFRTKKRSYLTKHIKNRHTERRHSTVDDPQPGTSQEHLSDDSEDESWNQDPDIVIGLSSDSSDFEDPPCIRKRTLPVLVTSKATLRTDKPPAASVAQPPSMVQPVHQRNMVEMGTQASLSQHSTASQATVSMINVTADGQFGQRERSTQTLPDGQAATRRAYADAHTQTIPFRHRRRVERVTSYEENGRKILIVEVDEDFSFE